MQNRSIGKPSVKRPPKAPLDGARSLWPGFRPVVSAIAAVGVLAAAANASAASPTPAHTGHWCTAEDEPWKQIFGTTINQTGVTLKNVYPGEGLGQYMGFAAR